MRPYLRLFAIACVLVIASIAWAVFGGVMTARTHGQTYQPGNRVADLWGPAHDQFAPPLSFHWSTEEEGVKEVREDDRVRKIRERKTVRHSKELALASTEVEVDLSLDERRKGLIWYPLYDVAFEGRWSYRHDEPRAGTLVLSFSFPDTHSIYDGFRFVVDGADLAHTFKPQDGKVSHTMAVAPGQEVDLRVGYESRGMTHWAYRPSAGGSVANLKDFSLRMRTDFSKIDFPAYTLSPSDKEATSGGWLLDWRFEQVVTGHGVGMIMPERIQPGELAAALSFSAPISLLFFFVVVFVLATLRGIDVHPLNYLLIAAAFFSFHLLFGYVVDHVDVVSAFALCSAVSMLLVTTYLRLVVSSRFAFVEAALAQLVYLIGFSLAHFFEGFTGLTVTVLSILTLFLVMQLTGRVRWSEALRPARSSQALMEEAASSSP